MVDRHNLTDGSVLLIKDGGRPKTTLGQGDAAQTQSKKQVILRHTIKDLLSPVEHECEFCGWRHRVGRDKHWTHGTDSAQNPRPLLDNKIPVLPGALSSVAMRMYQSVESVLGYNLERDRPQMTVLGNNASRQDFLLPACEGRIARILYERATEHGQRAIVVGYNSQDCAVLREDVRSETYAIPHETKRFSTSGNVRSSTVSHSSRKPLFSSNTPASTLPPGRLSHVIGKAWTNCGVHAAARIGLEAGNVAKSRGGRTKISGE